MFYFRTDANEIIATGHVMRCLTIAKELVRMGKPVCFLVSDNESVKLIKEAHIDYIVLNTDWKNLDNSNEYDKIQKILKPKDRLIVDSYSSNRKYIEKVTELCWICCFDDLAEEVYPADMLINYNIFYPIFDYKNKYSNCNTRLLLGGEYVPLRPQFMECRSEARYYSGIKKILFICGGGDKNNFIYSFFDWILDNHKKEFKKYSWEIIVGAYNKHKEDIYALLGEYENVELHDSIQNMAEVMRGCDGCISAASTVLYECCAMELPTIFYCIEDNQKYDALYFGKENLMCYAGDYREEPILVMESIVSLLKKISDNQGMVEAMYKNMHNLIDGKGAVRIAEELCK